jgi:hypothetical protein
MRIAAPIVSLAILLAGCQRTLYDWGTYESSVLHVYADTPSNQIKDDRTALEKEVRKSVENGRKVPPGKYAHLGFLCYRMGDTAAAAKYFQSEKAAFPESAKFIDDLLARLH